MKRKSDYQGWTNWDTWNTNLMIDNEQSTQRAAQAIVEKGIAAGLDDNQIAEKMRDWALSQIVGPHNQQAIEDAQEWNDIPEHERLDHSYEEFKEKHGDDPRAMDLFHGLVGGPDVGDTEPTLIDPEIVNWLEIVQGIKNTFEENSRFEEQEAHKGTLTPYDITYWNDEQTKMMDAWLAHHGVDPQARSYGPDGERERGVWGHMQWVPIDLIKQNVTEYGWPHGFGADHAKQIEQEGGWNYRTLDLGEQAVHAIQRNQAGPWQIQKMQEALAAKGYTPEEQAQIMRQVYEFVDEPDPYNPGQTRRVLKNLDRQPEPPDPALDQPGDLTLPEHWGSIKFSAELREEDRFLGENGTFSFMPNREDVAAQMGLPPQDIHMVNAYENGEAVGSIIFMPIHDARFLVQIPDMNQIHAVLWVEWIYVRPGSGPEVFQQLALAAKAEADRLGLPIQAYYRNERLRQVMDRYFQRAASWEEIFATPGEEVDLSHRIPFVIDFSNIDDPNPPIWIGKGGEHHVASPLYGQDHTYYGEIWDHVEPPLVLPSDADNDVYDELAKAHAERAYHQMKGANERTSAISVLYHQAPVHARQDILQNGIDYRRVLATAHPHVDAPDASVWVVDMPGGNYLSENPRDHSASTSSDMWEVNPRGLKIEEDPNGEPGDHWWVSYEPIPVSNISLVEEGISPCQCSHCTGTCPCPERLYDSFPEQTDKWFPHTASDGDDWQVSQNDSWFGPQNDSLYDVGVPGEAPGMPRNMITDSLHCPHCKGPMHGLKCPTCGFEKQATDMIPSGQIKVMPNTDPGTSWDDEGQWDTDTFLDHRMINQHLREQSQADQYKEFLERERRRQDASWPEIGIKEAADNVPGMPVSDSGHWAWLDGKVDFGGSHSEIVERLARDLGYDETKVKYLSNWVARGHCPPDHAIAVGTLKNGYPYIHGSTRDRNAVWDAVMLAREAA